MFTELHREEKRRERKETEVARGIKGGIKWRETVPASNQFPKCSPQSGIPREIHRVSREEKGKGGDRGDLGESQKGRGQLRQ